MCSSRELEILWRYKSKALRQYPASEAGPRALTGKATGIVDSALLTIW